MVKVTSLLIAATLVWFGDRASTDMKIWCVKGMYMPSLVPRPEEEEEEKGSGFSCLRMCLNISDITTW